MEHTLAIIKPDAFPRHAGAIITMATEAGLVPVRMVMWPRRGVADNVEVWRLFYEEHEGRHFFESLVRFMASGPVLLMVLEHPRAVAAWRELLGPTDSRKARETLKGATETVRGRFGAPSHFLTTKNTGRLPGGTGEYPMWMNAAHGRDSIEAAEREIRFFGLAEPIAVARVIAEAAERRRRKDT